MSIQIALVEDSIADAILLRKSLEFASSNCALTVFNTGESFLKEVDSGEALKYDLFILDVDLGTMSGLDLLESLRSDRRYRDYPVCMYTGHDMSSIVIRALVNKAQNYLIKSAHIEKLGEALKIEVIKATLAKAKIDLSI